MEKKIQVFISNSPNEPLAEQILKNLDSYNYSKVQRDIEPYFIALKSNNVVLAGAQCVSIWDWMYIKTIWVEESYRATGLGTKLMEYIENEAVKRKCVGIHLDTYSFQAKDFYLKLGFKIFGQIDDHPKGHTRYYLSKTLSP